MKPVLDTEEAPKATPDKAPRPDRANTIPRLDQAKAKVGDVDGVGPDRKHPFVIRNYKVWGAHWAFHTAAPSVLVDGMSAFDCNYGFAFSRMDQREHRSVSFRQVDHEMIDPWAGKTGFDFLQGPFRELDDQPPITVITSIRKLASGDLIVRGSAADNGEIVKVDVNGVRARPTADNFSQWEAVLSAAAVSSSEIVATGTDETGNVEKTPSKATPPTKVSEIREFPGERSGFDRGTTRRGARSRTSTGS